jgi:hypothetical protein
MSRDAREKPRLIIAVEGIITSDPLPKYWEIVAAATEQDVNKIVFNFNDTIKQDLFSGKVGETAFWNWLDSEYSLNDPMWCQLFYQRCYPLIAAHLIPRFADQAEVVLLSGERHEWIKPVIDSEDIDYASSQLVFTEQTGFSKDDSQLYQLLYENDQPTLYIDSQPAALATARKAGLTTLQADPELYWAETALQWLDEHAPSQGVVGWIKQLNKN